MDILIPSFPSRVNVSMDEGIVIVAKHEPAVINNGFDERVAEVRRLGKRYTTIFRPLDWKACEKPSVRTHPVLLTLYDLAWNAHTAREAVVLRAFASTLDMKIENTRALCEYRATAESRGEAISQDMLQSILVDSQREWASKWTYVLRSAQVSLESPTNDPVELLMILMRANGEKPPSPVHARTEALAYGMIVFEAKHVALQKLWEVEFERHKQSLAGKLVSVASSEDAPMPAPMPPNIHVPRVTSPVLVNDDLRRAAFDFAVCMQTIDELAVAFRSDLEETIARESAKMLVAIQSVEDESFKNAKRAVAAAVQRVDATLVDIERELERAYNSKDYRVHVDAMRSAIEKNLEVQRNSLYRQALAQV